MITHIVLFQPKAGVSGDDLRSFAQSIVSITTEFPSIQRARVGRAISVDAGYDRKLDQSTYKYAAVLEFNDQSELLAYLKNPKHAVLGRMFWEFCDASVVLEVEARAPGEWRVDELV